MTAHLEKPTAHPHVALITIDRPHAANALDPETLCALARHWQQINEDDEIRVAILTGAGDRVFCSGMDMRKTIPLSQALARGEEIAPSDFEGLRAVGHATLVKTQLRVPLIAAINGHARAGGFDLLLASEIRFAVPAATFALEEVALGLYPTGQATVALPRQIAAVHANELLYTADPIDAARALEIGLLNEIVAPEDLLERAFKTADRIANHAPLAVQATIAGVRELEGLTLDEAYVRQEELGKPLRKTEDAREAQRAFVEKRRPHFQGR
ncbi:MAG: enoyl-CoA hydratase-related protein [Myxococcota bacterium]